MKTSKTSKTSIISIIVLVLVVIAGLVVIGSNRGEGLSMAGEGVLSLGGNSPAESIDTSMHNAGSAATDAPLCEGQTIVTELLYNTDDCQNLMTSSDLDVSNCVLGGLFDSDEGDTCEVTDYSSTYTETEFSNNELTNINTGGSCSKTETWVCEGTYGDTSTGGTDGENCSNEFDPVCGQDSNVEWTFGNSCLLEKESEFEWVHDGNCLVDQCTSVSGPVCGLIDLYSSGPDGSGDGGTYELTFDSLCEWEFYAANNITEDGYYEEGECSEGGGVLNNINLDSGIVSTGDNAWDIFPSANNQNSPSGETRSVSFDVSGIESFTLSLTEDRDSVDDEITIKVFSDGQQVGSDWTASGTINGAIDNLQTQVYNLDSGSHNIEIRTFFESFASTNTFVNLTMSNIGHNTSSTNTLTETPEIIPKLIPWWSHIPLIGPLFFDSEVYLYDNYNCGGVCPPEDYQPQTEVNSCGESPYLVKDSQYQTYSEQDYSIEISAIDPEGKDVLYSNLQWVPNSGVECGAYGSGSFPIDPIQCTTYGSSSVDLTFDLYTEGCSVQTESVTLVFEEEEEGEPWDLGFDYTYNNCINEFGSESEECEYSGSPSGVYSGCGVSPYMCIFSRKSDTSEIFNRYEWREVGRDNFDRIDESCFKVFDYDWNCSNSKGEVACNKEGYKGLLTWDSRGELVDDSFCEQDDRQTSCTEPNSSTVSNITLDTGVESLGGDSWDVFPSGNNQNNGETRSIFFDVSCLDSFTLAMSEDRDSVDDEITIKVFSDGQQVGSDWTASGTINGAIDNLQTQVYNLDSGSHNIEIRTFFESFASTNTFVNLTMFNSGYDTSSTNTLTETPEIIPQLIPWSPDVSSLEPLIYNPATTNYEYSVDDDVKEESVVNLEYEPAKPTILDRLRSSTDAWWK